MGYKHYPDDVVRKFVEHAVKNGIDIVRILITQHSEIYSSSEETET